MKNILIANNTTEEKAKELFKVLTKYTDKNNECLLPYMGGNVIDKTKGYTVGLEIECINPITEVVLFLNNCLKKQLIIGKLLK